MALSNRPVFFVRARKQGRADPQIFGSLLEVLDQAGCELDRSFRDDEQGGGSPFRANKHAGLIVLGDSVGDADRGFAEEYEWIKAAHSRAKPILGICHGCQVLALALEVTARLYRHKQNIDEGLTELALTELGKADPIMLALDGCRVAQWHQNMFTLVQDRFTLNDMSTTEVVALAHSSNTRYPHCESFRVGRHTYGVQFHPEVTADLLRSEKWLTNPEPLDELVRAENAGHRVLRAWIDLVLGR